MLAALSGGGAFFFPALSAAVTAGGHEVDDAALAACLQLALDTATGDPEQRDALYGPVVPVPGDAPPLDRLLGLTGRDPAWTPAAARR